MRHGSCCDRHCSTTPFEIAVDPAPAARTDGPRDAAPLCPGSPMQLCRMLCPPMSCPAGQCLMRHGSCCDRHCSTTPFELASDPASAAQTDGPTDAAPLCP